MAVFLRKQFVPDGFQRSLQALFLQRFSGFSGKLPQSIPNALPPSGSKHADSLAGLDPVDVEFQ